MESLPSMSATLLREMMSCARLSIFWYLLSRSWSAFTRAVDAHEKKVSDRSVKAMIVSNVFISVIFLMVLMWKGEGGPAARGAAAPIFHLSLSRPNISPTATPYTSAIATARINAEELYIMFACYNVRKCGRNGRNNHRCHGM